MMKLQRSEMNAVIRKYEDIESSSL